MRWRVVVVALAACACPSKPSTAPGGGAGGSGAGADGTCAGLRGKIEQLYRADAKAREPARVDEAVADNTAMVMQDCAKDPPGVAACVVAAQTVHDLEARCLVPLDDEGSEGEALGR